MPRRCLLISASLDMARTDLSSTKATPPILGVAVAEDSAGEAEAGMPRKGR